VKRVLNENTGLIRDDSYFTECIMSVPEHYNEEVLITTPKYDRNTPYFIAFKSHENG
jgi:hypothetical protein